jgi:hypothetical protein
MVVIALIYRNAKDKEEVYYSEKDLKINTVYHVSLKCNFESASGLHQVALHVNGFDDLVASINYFQPFEHSQVSIG